MTLNDEADAYQTYLLRLWRTRCKGRWQWRVSMESPHSGERFCFASLEEFYAYLSEMCERQVPDINAPEIVDKGSERR